MNKPKYKIGDLVRLKSFKEIKKSNEYINQDANFLTWSKYCGKWHIVKTINFIDEYGYLYSFEDTKIAEWRENEINTLEYKIRLLG